MEQISQTLAQLRAKKALDLVRTLEGEPEKEKRNNEYAQTVTGFAAAIVMNGLGQALATLLASGRRHEELLYQHLEEWLCGGFTQAPYPRGKLLDHLVNQERGKYLQAQVEALAFLEWLKKFAAAYLKTDEGEE